ncbi:MAG: hypothetical protein WBQ49_13890 [Rhodomicrobium sp.]
MKLKISSFSDAGNQQKERLIIKLNADIEIGEYVVFCSRTSSDGNPTSGRKIAYWFPDGSIQSGDLVILYTKQGNTSTKELSDGRTAHFFYWGEGEALWDNYQNTAVILRVSDWICKSP